MAAWREALAAMLPMRANMARVTEEEEEAANALRRRRERRSSRRRQQQRQRRWEKMAMDRAFWDEDMAAARRIREIHELTNECRHRTHLARRKPTTRDRSAMRARTLAMLVGATTPHRGMPANDRARL
jgi:hypothetical protein